MDACLGAPVVCAYSCLCLQLCVCRESCKESWLTRMVPKKASNQHQAKSAAFAS